MIRLQAADDEDEEMKDQEMSISNIDYWHSPRGLLTVAGMASTVVLRLADVEDMLSSLAEPGSPAKRFQRVLELVITLDWRKPGSADLTVDG